MKVIFAGLAVAVSATDLLTFTDPETTFRFFELNDPVMGGRSRAKWSVGDGFGIMDGEVVDVPSLSAPGFVKAQARGTFADISEFVDGNLVLSVRSTNPEFTGYRVTFATGALSSSFACSAGGSLPGSRGCYKQQFTVPAGDDFVDITIPINTFSDKWSPATGDQTVTCADDADVCPTAKDLAAIRMVEFWAEGVGGKVHLEVKSVRAESAAGDSTEVTLPWLTVPSDKCSNKGNCGNAYQACCLGFQAKGFACGCHLGDGGSGLSKGDCGDCGAAYTLCCAGFAAKGFPCTCDVSDSGVVV